MLLPPPAHLFGHLSHCSPLPAPREAFSALLPLCGPAVWLASSPSRRAGWAEIPAGFAVAPVLARTEAGGGAEGWLDFSPDPDRSHSGSPLESVHSTQCPVPVPRVPVMGCPRTPTEEQKDPSRPTTHSLDTPLCGSELNRTGGPSGGEHLRVNTWSEEATPGVQDVPGRRERSSQVEPMASWAHSCTTLPVPQARHLVQGHLWAALTAACGRGFRVSLFGFSQRQALERGFEGNWFPGKRREYSMVVRGGAGEGGCQHKVAFFNSCHCGRPPGLSGRGCHSGSRPPGNSGKWHKLHA